MNGVRPDMDRVTAPGFRGGKAMIGLPALSHRMASLAALMMGVWAIWFSTSCNARNQNSATTHALEPTVKSSTRRFIPNELMVKFKDGVSQERIASILKDNQIDVIAEIQRGRLYHVKILDDRSVESAITHLTSHQEIEYAEPNYRYETQK
jgi:hypothetical protein